MKDRKITLSFKDRQLLEQLMQDRLDELMEADKTFDDKSGHFVFEGFDEVGLPKNPKELTCREFQHWCEDLSDRMFREGE